MSLWLYPWARKTVPYVADYVARFIGALVNAGVDPGGLHIVGHSLGAHLAGIAGLRANYTIGRITGLDPASPLFSYDESDRLCERSAAFVDVVHTCGLMLGFFSAIGHVDFYPNGGRPIQPGCKVDIDGECSHRRAHEYFVESVVTRGSFVATACDKWERFYSNRCRPPKYTQLGEDVPHTARGVYYLKTYGEEPFGMGRIGLT
ncbi:hypothetical protein AAG570_003949 [Ranatra chinensis]|uniref:Lipase domain-containing protein n=1 Tax=Ranatra chinensis TaxID=642074 RepID=A0ABD0YKI0_9HEMI